MRYVMWDEEDFDSNNALWEGHNKHHILFNINNGNEMRYSSGHAFG